MVLQHRGLAKKAKKAKKAKRVAAGSAEELEDVEGGEGGPVVDLKLSRSKLDRTLAAYSAELGKLRTGRPTPTMLDHVKVESYGQMQPFSTVAQATLKSPKLLVVNVFDVSQVDAVLAGIQSSGLNLNPQADNGVINVPLPKTTKESREAVAKQAASLREKTKVNLNNLRRDAMKSVAKAKKDKSESEDSLARIQKEVDALFEEYQAEVVSLCAAREKEILSA